MIIPAIDRQEAFSGTKEVAALVRPLAANAREFARAPGGQ
jgi:hypothetical protein